MQATGDKYACKILPGKTAQGDRRSLIVKEIAILQRVGSHPYTLTFHDAFEDDGKYYLIFELCTGGELFYQIMQKASLPCSQCSVRCVCFLSTLVSALWLCCCLWAAYIVCRLYQHCQDRFLSCATCLSCLPSFLVASFAHSYPVPYIPDAHAHLSCCFCVSTSLPSYLPPQLPLLTLSCLS